MPPGFPWTPAMLDDAPMGDQPHLLLVDDERSIREPLAV